MTNSNLTGGPAFPTLADNGHAMNLRRLHAENETLLEALGKMVAVYSGQVQNDGGYTVLDSVRPLITGRTALQPSAQGRISNDL